MNTETGEIYRGDAAIAAAEARGESLVRVSDRVAHLMEEARRNRRYQEERAARAAAHAKAKRKRKQARASKRRNHR